MSSLISLALICMKLLLRSREQGLCAARTGPPRERISGRRALELLLQGLELRAYASVEHQAPHLRDETADERRVGLNLEGHLLPRDPRQLFLHAPPVLLGQRGGAPQDHVGPAGGLVRQVLVAVGDRREVTDPAVLDEQDQEILEAGGKPELLVDEARRECLTLGAGVRRVGKQLGEGRDLAEGLRQKAQFLAELLDAPVQSREVDERLGVPAGGHAAPPDALPIIRRYSSPRRCWA